jgi:hypothetical protein
VKLLEVCYEGGSYFGILGLGGLSCSDVCLLSRYEGMAGEGCGLSVIFKVGLMTVMEVVGSSAERKKVTV